MPPGSPPPLPEALSTPERKRAYVRRLFSVIARRYDLITVVLSYGQDRRWKRRLAALAPPSHVRVLDLACGTGDIALELAASGRRVTGLDITSGMLEIAARKASASGVRVEWVHGDMSALPFPDGAFDIVTTGYGLRNVPDLALALREAARVLAPGGMLLSLDFNRPASPLVRGIYLGYLHLVGAVLGAVLHGEPDTYRYIPASIRRYPGAEGVAALARGAGFRECTYEPVLGGLMAIHQARR